MKLPDPAIERELLRLASKATSGTEPDANDTREPWSERLWSCSLPFVFPLILIAFVARAFTGPEMTHWRFLVVGISFLWTAIFGCGVLGELLYSHPVRVIFANLPISGTDILKWVRTRFFMKRAAGTALMAFGMAAALCEFDGNRALEIAVTGLLLFGTTVATIKFLDEPWIKKTSLAGFTMISTLLVTLWMFFLLISDKGIFSPGGTAPGMIEPIIAGSWLLPHSWCIPGRLEHGGLFLSLLWIGLGGYRWFIWPQRYGNMLDTNTDIVTSFDNHEDDEDDTNASAFPPTVHEMRESCSRTELHTEPGYTGEESSLEYLTSPMEMPGDGWVDRWVRWWIGPSRETLAASMGAPDRTYTLWTIRAGLLCLLWIIVSWVAMDRLPASKLKETVHIWLWIIGILIPLAGFLPVSNAIQRGMSSFGTSGSEFPFSAGFPIGLRQLLDISTRITIARCLVMILFVTPYLSLLFFTLDSGLPPWSAAWLVPAICTSWVAMRPLWFWIRIRAVCFPRRGTAIIRFCAFITCAILAIVSILLSFAGVFAGLMYVSFAESKSDMSVVFSVLGSILAGGLCARCVFELYLWMIRRRFFDLGFPK